MVGTVIGVLPGLGPTASIALLLPVTIGMDMVSSLIFLAGIYYGAMYGGSTTSILVNIPGEAASVVTCIDGYQMARQGRAGPALGMSAFGSFVGGTIGVVAVMLISPILAETALKFGAAGDVRAALLRLYLHRESYGQVAGPRASSWPASVCSWAASGPTRSTASIASPSGRSTCRTGSASSRWPWDSSAWGRSCTTSSSGEETGSVLKTPKNLLPTRQGLEGFGVADRAGQSARVWNRHSAGRHAGGRLALELCGREARVRRRRNGSARVPSRGWPARRRPTTPPPAGGFVPLLTLGIPTNSVLALMLAA